MQNFRNKKECLLRRGGANLYKSQIHRATDKCMGEEKTIVVVESMHPSWPRSN